MPQIRGSPKRGRPLPKELEGNFTCAICLNFYENPVLTGCEHVFCRECLVQHARHTPPPPAGQQPADQTPLCPLCRTQLGPVDSMVPAEPMKKAMEKFSTSCSNEGCKSTFNILEFKAHHRECEWSVTSCLHVNVGCEWRSLKKEIVGHLEVCPYHAIRKFYPKIYGRLDHVHHLAHSVANHVQRHEAIIGHHHRELLRCQQLDVFSLVDNIKMLNMILLWPQQVKANFLRWMTFPFHVQVSFLYIMPFICVAIVLATGRQHGIPPMDVFKLELNDTYETISRKLLIHRNTSAIPVSMHEQYTPSLLVDLLGDPGIEMRLGACTGTSWGGGEYCLNVPCFLVWLVVLTLIEIMCLEGVHSRKLPLILPLNTAPVETQTATTPDTAVNPPPQPIPPSTQQPRQQQESTEPAHPSSGPGPTIAPEPTMGFNVTLRQTVDDNPATKNRQWRVHVGPVPLGKVLLFGCALFVVSQSNFMYYLTLLLALILPFSLSDSVVDAKFRNPTLMALVLGFQLAWMEASLVLKVDFALFLAFCCFVFVQRNVDQQARAERISFHRKFWDMMCLKALHEFCSVIFLPGLVLNSFGLFFAVPNGASVAMYATLFVLIWPLAVVPYLSGVVKQNLADEVAVTDTPVRMWYIISSACQAGLILKAFAYVIAAIK